MPREQITHNSDKIVSNDSVTNKSSSEVTAVGHNVHVCWDPNKSELTVGVDISLEEVKRIAEPNPNVGWGLKIMNSSDPLSRKDINKLIATLRRARDKVYGADA